MRPVAVSGLSIPSKPRQPRAGSIHALEAAAPAILALTLAAETSLALDEDPPDCMDDAAATTVAEIDGAEKSPCAHQAVQPARVLQWESVARLTIGKPPRAPRVDVI